MLYLLCYYSYYITSLGILSPTYETIKMLYYLYGFYSSRRKRKEKITIVREEYIKEEDVVVVEMSQISG